MAELKTMYPAQPNTPETTLAGALTTSDTSVTVLDGSILPDAPNILTIGADTTTAETVLMTAKAGNVLTIERGYDGTTPRSWTKGDIIGRYFTAADQTAVQENIKALDTGKPDIVPPRSPGISSRSTARPGRKKTAGKSRRISPRPPILIPGTSKSPPPRSRGISPRSTERPGP